MSPALFSDDIPAMGKATSRMGMTRPVAPVRAALDEEAIFTITGDATVPEALVAAECPGGIIAVSHDVVVLLGQLALDHVDMAVDEDSHGSRSP